MLVLQNKRLLLLVGLSDLFDEVLGGLALVISIQRGGEKLVGL